MRKKTDSALQMGEEMARALLSSPTIYVSLSDLDGTILDANDAMVKRMGNHLSDIVGKTSWDLLVLDIAKSRKSYFDKAVQSGEYVRFEDEREGTWFDSVFYPMKDAAGKVTKIAVLAQDITERKKAEHEREALLHQLADRIRERDGLLALGALEDQIADRDALFKKFLAEILPLSLQHSDQVRAEIIFDTAKYEGRSGEMKMVFDQDIKVRGVERGHLRVGYKDSLMVDRNHTQKMVDGYAERLGKIIERLESREALRISRDKLEDRVRDRTAELEDANAALKVEITEREELETRLHQAQKMESIGTLAGGIAHDFNNILGAIGGYAELINMLETPNDSEIPLYVNAIIDAGNRATDLVKQIMTFSRQTEIEKKPLLLGPLAEESLKFLRASLPSTIKIVSNIADIRRPVLADDSQVSQIVMNLCTNAGHAMDENGGELTVSLEEIDLSTEEVRTANDLQEGRYARLTVSDTGIGMSGDMLDRIFDPYFTTKQKGGGTGLGLAVVHGILKDHKGAITVESTPGNGSTFRVYLPLEKQRMRQSDWEATAEMPKGSGQILLVDDEIELLKVGRKMLGLLGYEVKSMQSSIEGLQLFLSGVEEFDLVITDMTMPDMTGREMAEKMHGAKPNIPIVLCTGSSEMISRDTALSSGVSELVMKPMSLETLAQVTHKLIRRAGQVSEFPGHK